jgi:hypothetical protein
MRRALMISIMAVLLLSNTILAASTAPSALEVQRYVIGGGGGHSEAGGYVLRGTAGQPVAGLTSEASYDLCSGFWCGAGQYTVYLPLVLR